jgi:hypothetical protein
MWCLYLLVESDHTHDTIQEKSSRISNQVKETIKELWQDEGNK